MEGSDEAKQLAQIGLHERLEEEGFPVIATFKVQTVLGPRDVTVRQGPNILFLMIDGGWWLTESAIHDEVGMTLARFVPEGAVTPPPPDSKEEQ